MMKQSTEAQTEMLMKSQIVATLAAGIITSMGRTVSIDDVQRIHADLYFSFFPNHGNSHYQAWKKTFDSTKRYE